jgi:glutathione S-transferase
MTIQATEFSWEQLLEAARNNTSARRVRRLGQSPSSAPISPSLHKLPADASPAVVLYRDTNSWCPFCERVWFALEEKEIPFVTEFIDLFNKPEWFIKVVPTALVPVVKIEDQFVCGSKNILLVLEERFGATLLPDDLEENTIARQWVEEAETSGFEGAGFKFLMGRTSDPDELKAMQTEFESKLDELEERLGKYSGSYFLSRFSLVDIMYSSHLDRLAASLPIYRSYSIEGNPRFPRINAWFVALADRPAYHRVKSENTTNNLLFRRFWGIESCANLPPLDPAISSTLEYRAEAAERLIDNRDVAIADILKNSGLQGFSGETSAIEAAIETHLKLLSSYLLYAEDILLPWGSVGGKDQLDPFVSAVGAIALAYVRNRICAPRDMSAGAATAFRAAVDRLTTSLY